jgi:hypothetical protein
MARDELYEVLLVDGGTRWHTGVVVGAELDLLLRDGSRVLAWGSRAGLEHHAQQIRLPLSDELPDEIDLDLGGWLSRGFPVPSQQEVSELWHLLVDDPVVGKPLRGELVEEAYDDLVEEAPDWFVVHGGLARARLVDAVRKLRAALPQA